MSHELRDRVKAKVGRPVAIAPESIDEAITFLQAPLVLLAIDPPAPMIAALAEAVRRRQATVLAGSEREISACLEDLRWSQVGGRLFLAREWLANPDATLFGRRGAALVEPFVTERPRTLAESPVAVSERVRAELVRAATSADLRRYPPLRATRLIEAIARRDGIRATQLVVSAGGSMELLGRVLRACTDRGDEVLARAPTYDALASICLREGLALRLSERLDDPSARPRLIYVPCPSLPGAPPVNSFDLKVIRAALPPDRVLVIDEAYAGFTDLPVFEADPKHGPVIRLRTLSKLEGLAGLRVGYAIASEPIAKLLEVHGDPFSLPELLEDAAIAAIADEAHRTRTRRDVARWREKLTNALRARGFEVPDSPTHLLAARPPTDRFDAIVALANARALPIEESPSQPGWLQLSVLDDAGIDSLLAALDGAK